MVVSLRNSNVSVHTMVVCCFFLITCSGGGCAIMLKTVVEYGAMGNSGDT